MNLSDALFSITVRREDLYLILVPVLVFWPIVMVLKWLIKLMWYERRWQTLRVFLQRIRNVFMISGFVFFGCVVAYFYRHGDTIRCVVAASITIPVFFGANIALRQTYYDVKGWWGMRRLNRMMRRKGYW